MIRTKRRVGEICMKDGAIIVSIRFAHTFLVALRFWRREKLVLLKKFVFSLIFLKKNKRSTATFYQLFSLFENSMIYRISRSKKLRFLQKNLRRSVFYSNIRDERGTKMIFKMRQKSDTQPRVDDEMTSLAMHNCLISEWIRGQWESWAESLRELEMISIDRWYPLCASSLYLDITFFSLAKFLEISFFSLFLVTDHQ